MLIKISMGTNFHLSNWYLKVLIVSVFKAARNGHPLTMQVEN